MRFPSFGILALLTIGTIARAAPTTQPDPTQAITLADGTTVQLIGIVGMADQSKWWNGAGQAIDPPCDPLPDTQATAYSHAIIVAVTPSNQAAITTRVSIAKNEGPQMTTTPTPRKAGDAQTRQTLVAWKSPADQHTADLKIELTPDSWNTTFKHDTPASSFAASTDKKRAVFSPLRLDEKGNASLTVSFDLQGDDFQIVGFDEDAKEHVASSDGYVTSDDITQVTVDFDIPPDQIKRIEFRTRPYDRSVEFKGLPLDEDHSARCNVIVHDNVTQ